MDDLTLADCIGCIIEKSKSRTNIPWEDEYPRQGKDAPFHAYFYPIRNPRDYHAALVFMSRSPQTGRPFDARIRNFLRRQFPSMKRADTNHYHVDARDYALLKLFFGGEA